MFSLLLFMLPAALTMMVFTAGGKCLIKLQGSARGGFRQWCASAWSLSDMLEPSCSKPGWRQTSSHIATFPVPPGFHGQSSNCTSNYGFWQHVTWVQERTCMIRKNCLTSHSLINHISIFTLCPQVPLTIPEVKAALSANTQQHCNGKISDLLPVPCTAVAWGLWHEAIRSKQCEWDINKNSLEFLIPDKENSWCGKGAGCTQIALPAKGSLLNRSI